MPVSRPAAPAIVTGAGFLLALAATLAPPVGDAQGAAARLTADLPDWLLVAVFGSILLAGAIGIGLVLWRPPRRRKKGDDDYELYHEPRRLPPLVGLILIGLALSPAAILAGVLFWLGHGGAAPAGRSPTVAEHRPFARVPNAAPLPPAGTRPASADATGLVDAAAGLAVFGALGFVAWLAFDFRLRRAPAFDERTRARVAQAVDESLEDLAGESDARLAVQKIYRNFERVLASADLPKRAWQTPPEFMRSALAELPLPHEAVGELTRLFEIARFSSHGLGRDERDRAWHSLTAIRGRLGAAQRAAEGNAP